MLNRTCREFIDVLASKEPVPGGGGASALVGAIGIALGAMVGELTTGKKKYADDYEAFMEYLDEKVLDHVNGSWFHQLDRNNNLMGTVWPGKSDLYHATQATLIPYYTADLSIAPAVKEGKTV